MWLEGAFEVVVSPLLLAELRRVLAYAKIRSRVSEAEAEAFLALLGEGATVVEDRSRDRSFRTEDPHGDFVVVLAEASRAVIVSGDQHLLSMAGRLPVQSPAEFLRFVRAQDGE
jgi:putative PIN family toxin of toxin-antitoxin system